MSQIVMVSLEDLVPEDHLYRRFMKLWRFKKAGKELKSLERDNNYKGLAHDVLK